MVSASRVAQGISGTFRRLFGIDLPFFGNYTFIGEIAIDPSTQYSGTWWVRNLERPELTFTPMGIPLNPLLIDPATQKGEHLRLDADMVIPWANSENDLKNHHCLAVISSSSAVDWNDRVDSSFFRFRIFQSGDFIYFTRTNFSQKKKVAGENGILGRKRLRLARPPQGDIYPTLEKM
jgi:hypothetical protein